MTVSLGRAARTRTILLAVLVLALPACGGSGIGGGGSLATPTPTPAATYSVSGRVQKGPFAIGSKITLNALDSSLNATGIVYASQTTDALGDFSVATSISVPQVEILAGGFYFDELSGELSAATIELGAISEVSVNSSPTVNVLTTLQEQRLKTLVSQGSTFTAANTQSGGEVLALFGINAASVNSLSTFDSMQVIGSSDENAVLLAVSVILSQMAADSAAANGTTQPAELATLVNTIAAGIASTGALTSTTFTPAKNLADTQINAQPVTANLQAFYAKNGATVTVPSFMEWVDRSNSGVLPQRLVPVANLTFSAVAAAVPGRTQTSNVVTIAGLGAGVVVPVVASAGMTIIKNGVAVAGQDTTAKDGDTIAVQVAPLGYGQTNELTLSVGSSSAQWDVTSMPLGGSISGLTGTGLKLQDNLGDSATVSPGATRFSFAAQIALGKTYSVSVTTQPGSPPQVCDISGGSGTVGTGTAGINLVCKAPAGIAYIANSGSSSSSTPTNSISEYLIDATTGALISIGTIATGISPDSVTANPNGQFIYAANTGSTTVSAFSVTGTGALALVGTFAAGAEPDSISINPAGTFVYVADYGSSSVSEFAVNATTGALTSIGSVGASGVPNFITVDPTGRFVYTTNNNSGNITAYTIDSSTGALTNQGTVACSISLNMAIGPTGRFGYATCGNGVGIRAYSVDQTTGVLTNIATYSAGNTIYSVAVNPAGTFAYFSNWGSGFQGSYSIDTYSVNSSSGALTLTGSVATSEATQFTVDPSGQWLLTRDDTANIGVYSIDEATGALTLLGSTAIAIPGPEAIGIINVQ